ncbi:MAG: type II secretion system F family protein [Planctomycetota bacterium]|nr:type II secretion system F family protein [Planctomycetota bacterium]
MIVAYKGFDLAGKAVKGSVESGSIDEAGETLRKQGVFVTTTSLVEAGEPGASIGHANKAASGASATCGELSQFFRQLSILISTKTPLAEALEVIERQTGAGPVRQVIADLRHRVEQGEALSQAMRAHPQTFDAASCSMVAAGEAGGTLDQMLRALTTLLRQQYVARRAVGGALIYPCLLMTLGAGVLLIMIIFVLPQFQVMFDTLDTPVPWSTAMLLGLGDLLRSRWYLWIPLGAGFGATGWWWLHSPQGRAWISRTVLATPRIGMIACSLAIARIVRLLGALLAAKVNLLDSLKLARESTAWAPFAQLLDDAQEAVIRGQSLSGVFTGSRIIPPEIAAAIASGERSGQLAQVLSQIAEYLDEDNQQVMKTLSGIIEPLILTILGVVVGCVAISMFLPLFDLAGASGGAR